MSENNFNQKKQYENQSSTSQYPSRFTERILGKTHRGSYKKNKQNRNKHGEVSGSTENRIQRPPGLKGKEIGLFYKNLMHKTDEQKAKMMKNRTFGEILLSDIRKEQIQSILSCNTYKNIDVDTVNYSHMKDTQFKHEFVKTIRGNISDNLKPPVNIESMPEIDEELYNQHRAKLNQPKFINMLNIRKRLPSYDKKEELLKIIDENQVVLISGETGCGKTTQVAQFILDDYIERKRGSLCKIICTQPRRISAISVAERVAEERVENLGQSVGYHIRLEKVHPRERGSICYCTTGVILRIMQSDPCLTGVSHLILDEIHERDVLSDFILTILKRVIAVRKDLKLILMSATLNAESFCKYYNDCPHINIPGFTYPVEEYYLEDVIEMTQFTYNDERRRGAERKWRNKKTYIGGDIDKYVDSLERERKYSKHTCNMLRLSESEEFNVDLIYFLLLEICKKGDKEGAILVFVTGFMEISSLNTRLEKSTMFPSNKYLIFPLHSLMPSIDQKRIFQPAPPGVRKIILSTNIAETSITIDDVVYVIDCGKIKMSNYDTTNNSQTLVPEWVSLANASQRKGRAGRVRPGICYHLFTREREKHLQPFQKPEILRKRLEDVILTAKMLQLGKIREFLPHLLDPPEDSTVNHSLELLEKLNALDENENLTPLGYHLAKLPMGPQTGKMILFGAIFSCLDPILSVATALDYKDAFQLPLGKEQEADRKRRELAMGWNSDHLLQHIVLDRFEKSPNPRQFCWNYFLSYPILKQQQDMKRQFMGYLHDMNFVSSMNPKSPELNVNSENLSLIKAVVCAGLYPNVAVYHRKKKRGATVKGGKLTDLEMRKLDFHPKSVLSKVSNPESLLFVYYLKQRSCCNYIHDATMISPLPLVFVGDKLTQLKNEKGQPVLMICDKLTFKCSESTAELIKDLRQKLDWFLEYKISHPGYINWREDTYEINLLRAIMELITCEDLGDYDSDCLEDLLN